MIFDVLLCCFNCLCPVFIFVWRCRTGAPSKHHDQFIKSTILVFISLSISLPLSRLLWILLSITFLVLPRCKTLLCITYHTHIFVLTFMERTTITCANELHFACHSHILRYFFASTKLNGTIWRVDFFSTINLSYHQRFKSLDFV